MKTTRKQVEKAFLAYARDLSPYHLIEIFDDKYQYSYEYDTIEEFEGKLAELLLPYFSKEELLNIIVDDLDYEYTKELLEVHRETD